MIDMIDRKCFNCFGAFENGYGKSSVAFMAGVLIEWRLIGLW